VEAAEGRRRILKRIQEDIKNQKFERVYLLYGVEDYIKLSYRDQLVKALINPEDSMNLNRFEGQGVEEDAIIGQAETLPLFAARRVILVQNCGLFKRKADALADYLAELPDYLVMIFVESEADKRSRMYKAVKKYGHVAEFVRQSDDTLRRWFLGKLGKEKKKIRREEVELFFRMTGNDMSNISNEAEKLLSYTMGREVITREDILAICTQRIQTRIFDMVDDVAFHRQKEALSLYYDLLAMKEPPMRILYLLSQEFNRLYQIKSLMDEGVQNDQIIKRVGIPPFTLRKYLSMCRNYTIRQLEEAVADFVQTEADVKTGMLRDVMSVELMIVKYSAG
jgi:DNA polymerase-3 subunit delta